MVLTLALVALAVQEPRRADPRPPYWQQEVAYRIDSRLDEPTGVLSGTETIVYSRKFDPNTHWDNWVRYPFYPGYASVGVVRSVGGGASAHR